jgi:hypothetical protein
MTMKNIVKTGFGLAFVILGIMTFVFDFMTARNVVDITSGDPYPLQWASVVAAMLCVMGFRMIFRNTEQLSEDSSDSKEVFAKSYHGEINWWTSFKDGLSHNLENLGHVLRILH